jgi:hypothetical protein
MCENSAVAMRDDSLSISGVNDRQPALDLCVGFERLLICLSTEKPISLRRLVDDDISNGDSWTLGKNQRLACEFGSLPRFRKSLVHETSLNREDNDLNNTDPNKPTGM